MRRRVRKVHTILDQLPACGCCSERRAIAYRLALGVVLPQLLYYAGIRLRLEAPAIVAVVIWTAVLAVYDLRRSSVDPLVLYGLGVTVGQVLDYKTTTASAWLVHYANIYSPVFQQWVHTFQQGFLARGTDPFTAHQRALAVLQGLIYQQAAVVAFAFDFGMLGVLFLACLPLLVLIRRGKAPAEGHTIEI